MAWITIQYRPGFSGNLTSWSAVIERNGELSQTVEVRRFDTLEERTEKYSAQLTPEQTGVIERAIETTNFKVDPEKYEIITDTSRISISIQNDSQTERLEAPMHFWDYSNLWRTLDGLLPSRPHYRNRSNMSTRAQNESKFGTWEDLPDGGRRYRLDIQGRQGWSARYLKEVDGNETTLRFWQEIYDDRNTLVEIHEKYPVDKGHRKV